MDSGNPLPGKEDLTSTEREELVRSRRQVQQERDIMAKAMAWLCRLQRCGFNEVFGLAMAKPGRLSVRTMCRVRDVSVSGFYAWRQRALSQRSVANAVMTERIRQIRQGS